MAPSPWERKRERGHRDHRCPGAPPLSHSPLTDGPSVGPSQAAVRDVVSRLLLWRRDNTLPTCTIFLIMIMFFSVFRNRLYFTDKDPY